MIRYMQQLRIAHICVLTTILSVALVGCTRTGAAEPVAYLRGSVSLVMRIPDSNIPSEDLQTSTPPPNVPKSVTRTQLADNNYNSMTLLSASDAQAIDALQSEWCAMLPDLPRFSTQPGYYIVAYRCGQRRQQITIPRDELPPALQRLNAAAPQVTYQGANYEAVRIEQTLTATAR